MPLYYRTKMSASHLRDMGICERSMKDCFPIGKSPIYHYMITKRTKCTCKKFFFLNVSLDNTINISGKLYSKATCLKPKDEVKKSSSSVRFSPFCSFLLLWGWKALGKAEEVSMLIAASNNASVGSTSSSRSPEPWCYLFTHPHSTELSLLFYCIVQSISSSMAKSKTSTLKSVLRQFSYNAFLPSYSTVFFLPGKFL